MLTATGSNFATSAQILWNGSTAGVTMPAGRNIHDNHSDDFAHLVLYGTTASITVTDDAAKAESRLRRKRSP